MHIDYLMTHRTKKLMNPYTSVTTQI